MSDTEAPHPTVHAEWLPMGGLKIDINRVSAWQLFGLVGVLQMQAEIMQMNDGGAQAHNARKVIVPPPGLKV